MAIYGDMPDTPKAAVSEVIVEGRRILPLYRDGRAVGLGVYLDSRQSILETKLLRAGFVHRGRRPHPNSLSSGFWMVWRRPEAA